MTLKSNATLWLLAFIAVGTIATTDNAEALELPKYEPCGCEYEYYEYEYCEEDEPGLNPFVATRLPLVIAEKAYEAAQNGQQTAGADDLVQNLTWSIDTSYAALDDDMLGGDGNNWYTSLWATSYTGRWSLGLGVTYDSYTVDEGIADVEQDTWSFDLFVQYNVVDNLNVGLFIDGSYIDTEDGLAVPEGMGPILVDGDSDWYYGAGVLASYWFQVEKATITLNSTVASMLKDDLGDIFDSEDSLWLNGVAVSYPVSDDLAVEAHGSWSYFFDRSGDRDESFGTVGADLVWTVTPNFGFNFGVDHDLGEGDVDRTAGRIGATYSW